MTWNATVQRRLLLLLACLTATSGCTVCQNLRRTMCREPGAYSWKKDRARSLALYTEWAEEAWARECRTLGGAATPEYQAGFTAGFVEYVYAGGNGEPPPLPPREFWNAAMRSPQGQQLAEDWFAGYRHGAQTARAGGYRESVTMSTSLFGTEFVESEFTPAPGYPSNPSHDSELPLPPLELPTEPQETAQLKLEAMPRDVAVDRASPALFAAPAGASTPLAAAAQPVSPAVALPASSKPNNRVAPASAHNTRPPQDATPTAAPPTLKLAGPIDAGSDQTTLRIVPAEPTTPGLPTGDGTRSRRVSIAHEFIR